MKYVKYILFVVALIVASCTINDDVIDKGKNGGGKLRLMCRVLPFEGYNVLSRANGNGVGENDIVSLDYVIMAKLQNNNDSNDYRCVYYKHSGGTVDEIITIDIDETFAVFIENRGKDALNECYIAVLANYPELYNKIEKDALAQNYSTVNEYINKHIIYRAEGYDKETGVDTTYNDYKDLNYFTSVTHSVEPISGVPSTGIPRLGNFKGANGSGLVDITTFEGGNIYEVTLESLYAKMVFDINVDSVTQEIVGVNGNTFSLEGYTIHNLAQTVDMLPGVPSAEGENGGTDDQVYVYDFIGGDPTSIHYTSPRETEFTCYLPERFTPAATAANEFRYDFANGGAATARPEDRKLLQRYKPLLAQDDATYVEFTGTFVNHQGHSFDVTYKIYVGNDNYSNFDVVRNRQYNNIITIKGIDNSSDQSEVGGAVSIDHRVDVQRTLPIIVSLRRETLLDSHFEVRPMRIRANTQHTGTTQPDGSIPAVKVEVVYDDNDAAKDDESNRWIGLERSYGNGNSTSAGTTYCKGTNRSAHGKRKYFTTDLTYGTLNKSLTDATKGVLLYSNSDGDAKSGFSKAGGQTVIVPVNTAGECVWIYVDECLEASTDLKAIRSAKIVLTNGYVDNTGNFIPEGTPIEYIINQHKLFKIVSKEDPNRVYYIEHEEEYLHNFDADDAFGQNITEFEGMEWGLYNMQLSNQHAAAVFESKLGVDQITDWLNGTVQNAGLKPKYDFYITGHDDNVKGVTFHSYKGYDFCNEIIATADISNIGLDENPTSALQYVYSRNKVDPNDFTIKEVNWYLPAIDEMEEIMVEGSKSFKDFNNKFYWSSQPSYIKHFGHLSLWVLLGTLHYPVDFYVDDIGVYDYSANEKNKTNNVGRARASKANILSSEEVVYSPSGSSGYDNAYSGSGWGGAITTQYIGTYTSQGYNKKLQDWGDPNSNVIQYDEGNKLRSDKCRVRAVRRMDN